MTIVYKELMSVCFPFN